MADLLGGHRDRFNAQFPALKAFYEEFSKRHFFRRLNINVPKLPEVNIGFVFDVFVFDLRCFFININVPNLPEVRFLFHHIL